MTKLRILCGVAALGLLSSVAGVTSAQTTQDFLPTGADPPGNWLDGTNWDGPSGNFAPEGQFNEIGNVATGGTVFISSAVGNGVGGLFIADGSRMEVRSGGLMTFVEPVAGSMVDRSFLANGVMNLQDNGRLNVVDAKFGGTGTYEIDYTGATTTPISASGEGQLDGTLLLDFSAITNPSGTRTVLDAASFTGGFDTIETLGLANAQGVALNTIAGGINGQVLQAEIINLPTLTVNRATGAVSIDNTHTSAVSLDGYAIQSAGGSLNAPGATSLGTGWTSSAANDANAVSQLFEGTLGSPSDSLGASSTNPIGGSLYAPPAPAAFLEEVEDLVFTVTDAGSVVEGIVEYIGGPKVHNNLVLTIDGSGDAIIQNTSPFSPQIEAYRITSESGSLTTGTWDTVESTFGNTWSASASSDANALVELQEDDVTTLGSNAGFDLGGIHSGTQDVVFEFLLAGDNAFTEGVVEYGTLPNNLQTPTVGGSPGDFDNDGDVDGADFLFWQRSDGTPGGLADFRANYGAGNLAAATVGAVPEPCTVTLTTMVVMLGLTTLRCGQRQLCTIEA